ncbi:uncharacterized protein PADG_00028 [Paracoccidioides brasiliensis Pb18]|uniref:Mucin n=1 Tax=Paracoccidioides brasiliensis (strain Pb18) TaxID=502780 RepID=C1FZI8_PARBD|nr:uncharacterized protein PADG_00028 [Paracoccidioides brasiliensis Pb18]EEH43739.2 hypothetical protein PADG_00028 [Paracoccidioides brasiliensis Pb18]
MSSVGTADHPAMEYQPDDFYSLPPALRRKLFSNLERFRLERLRLAQLVHNNDGRSFWPRFSEELLFSAVESHPGTKIPATPTPGGGLVQDPTPMPDGRNRQKPLLKIESRPSRRLRKAKSVQVAYQIAQADSEWFRSLPTKVQQWHFSREEQYRLGGWRSSIIFDAADRALYKLGCQTRKSSESIPSPTSIASFPDSSFMASSVRPVDSAIGLDDSFYNSFRWLEEDEDIDLSLDDYHSKLAETDMRISILASRFSQQRQQRRQSSFRRTLSFTSTVRGRSSISSRVLSTSQSSAVPSSVADTTPSTTHKRSRSRPKSSSAVLRHISQASVSSIDGPAQYYQDPEARLKLRVYLASPQKFDEAIEFGFPSLDQKENICRPRASTEPRTTHESARTFSEDDSVTGHPDAIHEDGTLTDSPIASPAPTSPNPYQPQPPVTNRTVSPTPRLSISSRKFNVNKSSVPTLLQTIPLDYVQNAPSNREMTLKMTLTRPDLRTAESTGTLFPRLSEQDDPLRLADLPVPGEKHPVWDPQTEDTSMMRKMWRKIRKRRS